MNNFLEINIKESKVKLYINYYFSSSSLRVLLYLIEKTNI